MWRLLLFSSLATCFECGGKDLAQEHQEHAQFVGSVGCRSSSCHGGAGEKRSQFITWSQKDFHTRGYAILLDARSARMGEAIGIPQPQSSDRCTTCHSPFASVASSQLGPNVRSDEGVSCESCHGAAAGWLRGHTRPDWTYGTRVAAGMHDLRNLYVRANACAACHQNVDGRILNAGHPPLVFELDSQSVNEPRHWRETDSQIGPRSWLAGQAVALRESAWHARVDAEPSPDSQRSAIALAWLLAKITLSDPALPKVIEPSSSDLELLEKQADDLARRAGEWNATTEVMMSMMRMLGDSHSEFTASRTADKDELLYRAIRVSLALDRLNAAAELSSLGDELAALRQDVQRRYDFDAAAFAEHLRSLRARLRD